MIVNYYPAVFLQGIFISEYNIAFFIAYIVPLC